MDRHEEFVTLARPFATEDLTAVELYRVIPEVGGLSAVLIGVCLMLPFTVAVATGFYWLDTRIAIWPLFGLLWMGSMIVRRVHKEPNIVLMGLGHRELVVLRASFMPANWKVLDEVGHWPLSDLRATAGTEVLAFELHPPDQDPLSLQPLAITHDASLISAALLGEPPHPS